MEPGTPFPVLTAADASTPTVISGFWDALQTFLLGSGNERLVFVVASGLFGLCIVLADRVQQALTRNRSWLGIGPANPWLVLALWPLGAALAALLCHASGLIQPTIQASVLVAAAWTVYLPRLISRATDDTDEQPPGDDESGPPG